MLSLRTVVEVVVSAASIALYFWRLGLFFLLQSLFYQLFNEQSSPLPTLSFTSGKENLSFPYAFHSEPRKAKVGWVVVPTESFEMGCKLSRIDVFNEDGQAHVPKG